MKMALSWMDAPQSDGAGGLKAAGVLFKLEENVLSAAILPQEPGENSKKAYDGGAMDEPWKSIGKIHRNVTIP